MAIAFQDPVDPACPPIVVSVQVEDELMVWPL